MKHNKKKIHLSKVSIFHYFRLIFRSILFIGAVVFYVLARLGRETWLIDRIVGNPGFLMVIWVVFVFEMILRFFPSKLESPGCQKQFAGTYIKNGETDIEIADNNATVLVALLWVILNGILGALALRGIFDDGIMILICLAYSVCDMICILFFCPFQTWFLKNKCCAACRIYNWDYAMMFTPLFFVKSWYAWSLLALSIALLLRWEITIVLHPERFSEKTNGYLTCANCTEKLCTHKKQLRSYWKQLADFARARTERLRK